MAFIMDQDTPRATDYCEKAVSIEALKERVGYQLPVVTESAEMKSRVGC
ncbi:hypothetical protein [Grimontia marina]|nr:hypothetical protein [Grimontia marina]